MVGLYIIQFSSPSGDPVKDDMSSDTLISQTKGEKTGRIYYVNTDSVWGKYKYVQEITDMMEGKKAQYTAQVERQVRDFEMQVNDLRQKAATMGDMELQIKQRELMSREAELQKMGEELEMRFIQEEQEWNEKLRDKIVNYIDDATKDRSYDFILSYSDITSAIVLANDSLDLTDEIVEGLNRQYDAEQSEIQE